MRRRLLISCGILLLTLFLPAKSLRAQTIILPEDNTDTGRDIKLDPGEELRCIAQRSGIDTNSIAIANRMLKASSLPIGTTVRVPPTGHYLQRIRSGGVLMLDAITSGYPEYLIRILNPIPRYGGEPFVVSAATLLGNEQETLCAPYPVRSITASSYTVTRGQTLIIAIETEEPVVCEATYLGHSEPCYSLDAVQYFVLLGISALETPGDYVLGLHLHSSPYMTSLNVPFTVSEGNYSFQYINPPANLYALLDEKVFRAEEAVLKPYREVRTPYRSWEIPLGFPLTMQLSISADYGDRRSYGGMVDGYHSGVDFSAWSGLPVLTPADGVVLFNDHLKARGNAVLIDHGWGLVTGFWHLSASNVEIGQLVRRGEIIGKVGNSGLSTGSHLHWETWVNGVSVDGYQWYESQTFGEVTKRLNGQ